MARPARRGFLRRRCYTGGRDADCRVSIIRAGGQFRLKRHFGVACALLPRLR